MMPWVPPCGQRALKAQQYRAWGNAPGTRPSSYCRATGAKVAVGVTTANGPMDEAILVSIMGLLALSPVVTFTASFIESRLRLGRPSKFMALGLHFFCAYSAHCVCGDVTWGVAPGFILLTFSARCLWRRWYRCGDIHPINGNHFRHCLSLHLKHQSHCGK